MTRIAVLGGGQLGRMLGLAGIPLGCSFAFLDPVVGAPAAAVGELTVGALDDVDAAQRMAKGADVITYEWEGVPAATARALQSIAPVAPGPRPLEISQDRVTEKRTLESLGVATARFHPADSYEGVRAAVHDFGLPAVVKTRRGGYDGKGQVVLRSPADVELAWETFRGGDTDLLVEEFVAFDRELSILAVRGRDGTIACWPVVENEHRNGILHRTLAPAPGLDDALQLRAEGCIRPLLTQLDYVGVCCVELFDVGGTLLANEIAPRVHNSGHWTIEGAETSQFENHVRAVAGMPLGSTAARGVSAMVNCIGRAPNRDAVLHIEGAHLHDYDKAPRPGRKLGHITVTAPSAKDRDERLAELERVIGGPT